MRNRCEVVIYIDIARAIAEGMDFFRASNDVVCSRGFGGVIPPTFILEIREARGGGTISWGSNTEYYTDAMG